MATHYSILAWRIPWTVEPGGRQSMGLQRVRQIEQLTKSKKISVKCQITQNYLFKEMQWIVRMYRQIFNKIGNEFNKKSKITQKKKTTTTKKKQINEQKS